MHFTPKERDPSNDCELSATTTLLYTPSPLLPIVISNTSVFLSVPSLKQKLAVRCSHPFPFSKKSLSARNANEREKQEQENTPATYAALYFYPSSINVSSILRRKGLPICTIS
jgi:hypothetical protein